MSPGRTFLLLVPSGLIIFLVMLLFAWHASLLWIDTNSTFAASAGILRPLIALYFGFALVITSALSLLLYFARTRRMAKKSILAVSLLAFIFSLAMRMVDWGSLYFGGQHVDAEFWYHAFYADGASFLLARISFILIGIMVMVSFLFYALLRLLDRSINVITIAGATEKRHGRDILFAACANFCTVILCLAILYGVLPSMDNSVINLKRTALFARIPEREFIGSFAEYFAGKDIETVEALDDGIISKLGAHGIKLYSMDSRYPLMKKSIYIGSGTAAEMKPAVAANTNVIIIFAESLSGFFLQDEFPDLKVLTPNFHDMRNNGYSFTRMFNANYPTIRGMIATLGSSLYSVEKIRAKEGRWSIRVPILSRFLFISDILKKRGYATLHLQGGSGTFVGMRNAFLERQSYDQFISRESLELITHAKYKHNSAHWGVRDEDVFRYGVKMLKEGMQKPFLLTISTLDMHPPFDPLFTHPAAKNEPLLDCLYSTDRAFGVFWKYFKNSPYRHNTIVVMVADHAMGPNAEYIRILNRHGRQAATVNDIIPCIMYWPGNRDWRGRSNNTLCTNLDIAPTLLDMMNIDVPNPFLGLSVFSERPWYPFIISDTYLPHEKMIMDRLSAGEQKYIRSMGWTAADDAKFSAFLKNCALRRVVVPDIE